MAKPYSHMDTEKLEDTIKMDKKSTAKGTISSLPHQIDPYLTKTIATRSSEQELKLVEHNYKMLDLSSQDLNCIPDYLFSNSEVEELDLSHNPRLGEEKNLDFPELEYLKKLNLSYCNFKKVPYELLKYQRLRELNFSYNSLQSYNELESWRDLWKLDLSGCGLTEFPGYPLLYSRLRELNLSNNPLKHLTFLIYYTELEKLDLSGCSLITLPDGLFYYHELKELNLSNNPLKHSDLLEELGGYHRQGLKVIFDDVVYIKNYLKDVGPSWSIWSVYPERTSSPTIAKLTKINITGDGSRICGDHLKSSKQELETVEHNYKKLDLSSQDLKCIPDYLFLYSKVEELDLSNNPRLGKEKNLVFPELKYLKKLNLSYCYFKKVPNELRKYLRLEELNFSYNSLEFHFELQTLRNLWKLDLSGCGLTELSAHSLVRLRLRELNLSNNPLKHSTIEFSPRFYRCYPALEKLDLSGCGLLTLPDGLRYCKELKELNLSNNPLKQSDYPDLLQKLGGYHRPGLKVIFDDAVYIKDYHKVAPFVRTFPHDESKLYRWPRIMSSYCAGEIDDKTPIADVTTYSVPVVLTGEQNPDNSIAVDEQGGCFCIPATSSFLLFPPQAVEEQVAMTYSRVMYKDCEVKPKEGEAFVSRILRIEPKGMTFRKPVTVLLSHSAYEDQDFLDFYELIVENLDSAACQELRTERISSIEDVPREIINPEVLGGYLPFAKATIHETCTLVAATRVKFDKIFVPTNIRCAFSKKYGENKELKITFPAGVTEKKLCLTVQLYPADDVLNPDVYLDNNLVCVPVIKVSGQTNAFLKPVDVELTYSHDDVADIDEEFLPVGRKMHFTSELGLLLRSQEETESQLKWLPLNENNNIYIERLRKDQLKFSFSVKHFCKTSGIVKKSDNAQVLHVQESSSSGVNVSRYAAIVLAVHETGTTPKRLNAVLAPSTARRDVKEKWKVDGIPFGYRLKCEEPIYFCVPLTDHSDDSHLPLTDYTMWFDPDVESVLANNTDDSTHLTGRFMRFLRRNSCKNGSNHSTQGDCRAKAPIHNVFAISAQTSEVRPGLTESYKGHNASSGQEETPNNNVQRKKVLSKNISRFENFEENIESEFLEKLEINKNETKNPDAGKITKAMNDAGAATSIVLGFGVGATLALSIGSFGVPAIVGATVAGLTFTVAKIDKKMKKRNARELDKTLELYFHSHLKYIIKDVAKELSRIYEYQLLALKDDIQAEILAKCAVNLMLDLKKGDKFDRNTLLKKVLQDGNMKKKELLTINGNKWSVPDVFRKPGLRRSSLGTNHAEFKYFVKPDSQACDTQTYGYRGQFLEIKKYGDQIEEEEKVQVLKCRKRASEENNNPCEDPELCHVCSSYHESCTSGQYFVESSVDSKYTEHCEELRTDCPIHVLVQCPKVLDSFIDSRQAEELSLADFLKNRLCLCEDHIVLPVYRQHSPGKGPDLKNSVLTGSDFSHSDFTNCSLEKCDFTKCVMLFAELAGAKMSGSRFVDTLISHSNLMGVIANHCEWTKTSLLFSRVDGADLGSVESTICGNCLDGTNIDSAITGKNRMVKVNETPV